MATKSHLETLSLDYQRHSLEIEVFERKMDFDDASSFDSRSQNILFSRLVILGSQSVQIV